MEGQRDSPAGPALVSLAPADYPAKKAEYRQSLTMPETGGAAAQPVLGLVGS